MGPDATGVEGASEGSPRATSPSANKPRTRSARRAEANDNDVGKVLRSVYQKAVDEDIPAEMLDLLSKLD